MPVLYDVHGVPSSPVFALLCPGYHFFFSWPCTLARLFTHQIRLALARLFVYRKRALYACMHGFAAIPYHTSLDLFRFPL